MRERPLSPGLAAISHRVVTPFSGNYFTELQPFYRAVAMREIDRQTSTTRGISEYDLMCEAGKAAFNVLASQWPEARRIFVLCGTGNNGGDGWVLARLAHDAGYDCRVALFGDPSRVVGTARIAHDV